MVHLYVLKASVADLHYLVLYGDPYLIEPPYYYGPPAHFLQAEPTLLLPPYVSLEVPYSTIDVVKHL